MIAACVMWAQPRKRYPHIVLWIFRLQRLDASLHWTPVIYSNPRTTAAACDPTDCSLHAGITSIGIRRKEWYAPGCMRMDGLG